MTYYRRPENKLESLLRWRRNVFLQLPGGGYVLVSATRYVLTLHHFNGSFRHDPTATEHLNPVPGLFDGQGWNLTLLSNLIQPEKIMTNNQQPFTALYCKPFREAIPKMSDIELRAYCYLATFTDGRGVCDPGVRTLVASGLSATEVSDALAGLARKGIIYFLRYNQRDSITGRMMTNVMGANPEILRCKSDSGIHTYMQAFLNQFSPSNHAQPESPESNTSNQHHELAPVTTTTNHHQNHAPDGAGKDTSEGVGAAAPGKDYANQADVPIMRSTQNAPPARSATQNPSPSSAPPPPDLGALKPYAEPLPDADLEAYANELNSAITGLQIAKARQLVVAYGVEQCQTARRLLARQPFGSVEKPAGWLINKLRQGALVPAIDGAPLKGRYDDFIQS